MSRLTVDANVGGLKAMLDRVSAKAGNTTPALKMIGQTIMDDAVIPAFRNKVSPNGVPWPPLTAAYLAQREGKGTRPLQRTGVLKSSFNYQMTDVAGLKFISAGNSVSIGTPFDFFKYHQHLPENEHLNQGIMPERAALPKLTPTGQLPGQLHAKVLETLNDYIGEAIKK